LGRRIHAGIYSASGEGGSSYPKDVRIRIVRKPSAASIDGIRLDHLERGYQYEVGNALGAVLLAEGWAEPADNDHLGRLIPFPSRAEGAAALPANLIREKVPPYLDQEYAAASDFERRQRPRPSRVAPPVPPSRKQ
jgi:hypothetical protein